MDVLNKILKKVWQFLNEKINKISVLNLLVFATFVFHFCLTYKFETVASQ